MKTILKAWSNELFNGWSFVGYILMAVLIFGESDNPNTMPALLITMAMCFIGQDIIDAIKENKNEE